MATKLDEPQSEIDKGYSRGSGAYSPVKLNDAENSAFGDIASNYDKTAADGTKENSASAKANEAEKTPNQSFVDNFTGGKNGKNGSLKGNMRFAKKFGPTGGVIGVIAGLGMLGLSFTPAALLVNLKENLVQKFDIQNTSMSIRTDKIIAKKIAGDTTSGSCSVVKIACRFVRPSNRLLTQLEKNGITPINKDNQPIDKTTLFPNERPSSYEFTDSTGKKLSVSAEEFADTIKTNAEFRSAFHAAYNPRFVGYADAIFTKVMARFGIKKNSDVSKATDTKAADDAIATDTASEPNTVSEAGAANPAAANDAVDNLLTEDLAAEGKNLEKQVGGKTDAAQIGAMVGCVALDLPGIVSKTARAYQLTQLVKYGYVFLSLADAIKSGDATPQSMTAAGDILTNEFKDNKGNVTNGSAMDSFGIKYSIFGDTSTSGYKKDFKNFTPGGSVSSKMGNIAAVTSSPYVKATCNAIGSPEAAATMTAAEAALAPETFGLSTILAKSLGVLGSQLAATGVLSAIITKVALLIIKSIPTDKILSMFMGDLTKNLQGEDVGNALASGSANMMSQTANAGGNAPMSVDDALAYNGSTAQVNLAYAQEDQATLSPLDASSPNTFLGSIATQMLPYFSNLSSVSGVLSSFGNILSGSISLISGNTYAASAANARQAYTMCPDTSIANSGVAAGPFCDIQYGVPPKYLDEDPSTVITNLISSNQIDQDSGNPIDGSDLANWLTDCTSGSTIGLADCQITNQKTAEYSLYTIDHRIQVSMDDDTTTTTTAAPAVAQATGTPDNVTAKGSGWVLKDNVDYSAIPCASGTTDSGLYTHPTRGFTIRKCGLAGGFVASIASQSAVDMFNSAKTSGITLKIDSGFRTYDEQMSLRVKNCANALTTPPASCHPPTEIAGSSQHEAGLAVDLNYGGSSGFAWLKANASKFGYFNLPSEAWHWSKSGS